MPGFSLPAFAYRHLFRSSVTNSKAQFTNEKGLRAKLPSVASSMGGWVPLANPGRIVTFAWKAGPTSVILGVGKLATTRAESFVTLTELCPYFCAEAVPRARAATVRRVLEIILADLCQVLFN